MTRPFSRSAAHGSPSPPTSIPAEPYITADPERVARFPLPEGRKIGLAWFGQPTHPNDRYSIHPVPDAGAHPVNSGHRIHQPAAPAHRRPATGGGGITREMPCRHRGDHRSTRSGDLGRYGGCTSRRRDGKAGLDHAAVLGRFPVDGRENRQPLVSVRRTFPPRPAGRLAGVVNRIAVELKA